MIKVNVKLLPRKSNNIDNITIDGCNMITKGIAENLQKEWGNAKCENHPNHTSIIILNAVYEKKPTMTKEGFCCKEFSDKFILEMN